MFSPEMMQAAQSLMSKMSPEDMKRMSEWAANMDPSMMEGMMQNMGTMGNGIDPKKVSEQMKNMSPEQLQASMSQAQAQMGAQKQYMFNASTTLKNEGNALIKHEKYDEALAAYDRALENILPFVGEDIQQLRHSLLLNKALCHLKQKDYQKTVETCDQALKINAKSFKAVYRRGLAKFEMGQLSDAVTDVQLAAKLSPEDKTIASELTRVMEACKSRGLSDKECEDAEKEATTMASAAETAAAAAASSSSSSGAMPPFAGLDMGDDQMKMISRVMQFLPYILMCIKWFGYVRRPFKAICSQSGRVVLAVVVVLFAVLQHYRILW